MPWDHPLYVMLGQLFLRVPLGEPAYRVNLMSALAGAGAVAMVYRIGVRLVRDRWAALLGALALAVSHTFWFHAVTTEVYALHALVMAGLIWLALRGADGRRTSDRRRFALLAGIGLANHVMLVLTLLPTASYLVAAGRAPGGGVGAATGGAAAPDDVTLPAGRAWVFVGSTAGWFLLGLAPWWVQFVRMAGLVGVPTAFELASGLSWVPGLMFDQSASDLAANLGGYAALLVYQFTPVGVALGVGGARHLWRHRRRECALLAALYVGHAAFSANYPVGDRFAFHLPSYVVFSLFITGGLAGLSRRLRVVGARGRPRLERGVRNLLLAAMLAPVVAYAAAPPALRTLGRTEASLGIPPIGTGARDGLAYFLDPNRRGDDAAARFGRSALVALPPGSLVFAAKPADTEAYLVLRYVQVAEGRRPDVRLEQLLFVPARDVPGTVLAAARAQAGCQPLYLASLNPTVYPLAALRADFELVPEANLYRLVPRYAPPAAACHDRAGGPVEGDLGQLIRSAMQ